MKNDDIAPAEEMGVEEQGQLSRRDFLAGLRKWSTAVIGIAVAGGALFTESAQAGWVNRRGSWINGGGGGGWINRGGSWINGRGGGGGSWVNRRGW